MAETTPTPLQQATAPTPKTKPAKNPKRVAAGKMVAERTRCAHEAQKKEANAARDAPLPQAPPTRDAPAEHPQPVSAHTTTQWLAIGSLIVSLIGIYYKREEIKNVLSKKPPQAQPAPPQASPPQAARGLRNMD